MHFLVKGHECDYGGFSVPKNDKIYTHFSFYSHTCETILYQTQISCTKSLHSTKKPVTTMLTYPWKCTVLHCNHLGNTWKPLVLMTRHFDYCPSASEGDNQSVRSSAPVVSRCFPGGYNVKLYISRGRLAWWLLAFLQCLFPGWENIYSTNPKGKHLVIWIHFIGI